MVWTPLKNMKVSWDDYSQYMGKKNVPNHQPGGLSVGVLVTNSGDSLKTKMPNGNTQKSCPLAKSMIPFERHRQNDRISWLVGNAWIWETSRHQLKMLRKLQNPMLDQAHLHSPNWSEFWAKSSWPDSFGRTDATPKWWLHSFILRRFSNKYGDLSRMEI